MTISDASSFVVSFVQEVIICVACSLHTRFGSVLFVTTKRGTLGREDHVSFLSYIDLYSVNYSGLLEVLLHYLEF